MLKNPAYCGERSLRETGGLVASLLNVAHWLRFRCSLLGRPSRFGLARLATAGVFNSPLGARPRNRRKRGEPMGERERQGPPPTTERCPKQPPPGGRAHPPP